MGTRLRVPIGMVDAVGKNWTASEVALSFSLTEVEAPTYQRIARQADRLRALGLSVNRIAEHLGVDDKTVAKALRWTQNPAG